MVLDNLMFRMSQDEVKSILGVPDKINDEDYTENEFITFASKVGLQYCCKGCSSTCVFISR